MSNAAKSDRFNFHGIFIFFQDIFIGQIENKSNVLSFPFVLVIHVLYWSLIHICFQRKKSLNQIFVCLSKKKIQFKKKIMQNFKKIIQKQKKKPVRLTHTEIKKKTQSI